MRQLWQIKQISKDHEGNSGWKCCESGDLLGENMPIQQVESGDLVAVLSTGAYNYSMASNYNRLCRPAVVMVKDHASRVIVKRETMEDLVSNDL